MRKRDSDEVSASEIASWAWCPESWRLNSLGAEPENQTALERGERRHGLLALFERWSALAIRIGLWLFVLGLVLALLAYFFARVG